VVAVTGATGHLGTVLVGRLLAEGERVVCLVRPGSPAPELETTGAAGGRPDRREVDFLDGSSVAEALRGASVVYHAAALVSFMPGGAQELHRANVETTRVLLGAARVAGVRRFVYVGSIEAFPLEDGPYPITEAHTIDPERTVMEYGRSKAVATRLVLEASADDLECVVCCPTAFLGPPDYRRSPLGSFVHDFVTGRLPAAISGGFDFADVRDVADGLVRAARSGRAGRIYLLSGRYATVPELLDTLRLHTGARGPSFTLPVALVAFFAPIVEHYYRLSGRPPRFTRHSLRLLSLGVRVDGSRAREELGYACRPLEETLADTVDWFTDATARRARAPSDPPDSP
jgi:dihydroflavonol-4-reductase